MSTAGNAPLTWGLDDQDGLVLLSLGGTLTMTAAALVHDVVAGARQRHRTAVLIDVSALVVTDRDVVAVFTSIMAEAVRWPDVLVLICAPTTELTLLGADVLDPRLLFDSVTAGRTAAVMEVPSMTEDMLPVAGAARRARDVATEACLRWDEPGLVGSAALVASELVTNAAMHAETMMTLQIRLRPCHLYVAVFDGSDTQAVTRPAGPDGGGRGLRLVDAFSAVWGSTSLPNGKVVWSALDRPRGL